MPTARHSHASAVGDGIIAVTGGRSPSLGNASTVIELYNIGSDTWSALPDAPFKLGGHGAAIIGDRLHIYGGEDIATGQVVTRHVSLNLNDPPAIWREEAPLPHPRHGFATAAINGSIYILGGGKRAGLKTPWSVTGTALKIKAK